MPAETERETGCGTQHKTMKTFLEFLNPTLSSAARVNVQHLLHDVTQLHHDNIADRATSVREKRLSRMLADLTAILVIAVTGQSNINDL
jgi:hypothetical protein